jgi:type IV secretory pathway VirB3-like protein
MDFVFVSSGVFWIVVLCVVLYLVAAAILW